jgi:hypothetical protein
MLNKFENEESDSEGSYDAVDPVKKPVKRVR